MSTILKNPLGSRFKYAGLGVLFCALIGAVVVAGCQLNGGPASGLPAISVADYSPARPQSRYADRLVACAGAQTNALCTFEQLPLLGQQTASPTIADLMDRIVVSHQWMGMRFEQALRAMPAGMRADILQLSKSITSISIGANIRPSHYRATHAAYYLDAATLWTTLEEKRTVATTADYRSGFGDGLPFHFFWRVVKDNQYAYSSFSLTDDSERTTEDTIVPLARLLAHELAHAADFVNPRLIPLLERNLTPLMALQQYDAIIYTVTANDGTKSQVVYKIRTSDVLHSEQPLMSPQMHDFAQARYAGNQQDYTTVSAYSAVQMGEWFDPDGANHAYSYTSIREDVAMLLEMTLMKLHFNIDYDTAFIIAPTVAEGQMAEREDYVVGWGARGRVGEPTVHRRAQLVAERLLPRADATEWSTFFEQLPPSSLMENGCDWWDNLDLVCDPVPEASRDGGRSGVSPEEQRQQQLELELQVAEDGRHPHG